MTIGHPYNINDLANAIGVKKVINDPDQQVDRISIDSRKIFSNENLIFIALKGKNWDAHDYIQEAYEKGVRNFIIEKGKILPSDANIIYVENTLDALQKWALIHREQFTLPIIAITGSNGKTIVKEWLFQLLKFKYSVVRSPKSYNSQIGVPLSLLQINDKHGIGLIEAGISTTGEMKKLERLIKPEIGILTNIGNAHDAGFNNRAEKIKEKLFLFNGVKTFIYNTEDISKSDSECFEGRSFNWGTGGEAVVVESCKVKEKGSKLDICYNGSLKSFYVPFKNDVAIKNATHCICLMLSLGLQDKEIQNGLESLGSVSMRLEQKKGINNITLINDSYNSDLLSLENALRYLDQQNQHTKKVLILSDILETGYEEKAMMNEIYELVKKEGLTHFIGIGKSLMKNHKKLKFKNTKTSFFKTTDDFLNKVKLFDFNNSTILVKGARKFNFEKIVSLFEERKHNSFLEINLDAIIHNLRTFRSKLKKGTKLMAMVKASGYGSGKNEIANLLEYHKVDYLGVAFIDEAIELRRSGITLPIMVMSPEPKGFESIIEYSLEPEIYSLELLLDLLIYLENNNIKNYPIHIKLDTGMHRLGFEEKDIDDLINKLEYNQEYLNVKSIFSHLVASDDKEEKIKTNVQIELFKSLTDKIIGAIGGEPMLHILNSSGIVNYLDAQFDMVRLGIGLYGIDPSLKIQTELENVMALKSHISQIKEVKVGETVGYGNKLSLKNNKRIATISIGYADGINRLLGNGKAKIKLNGKEVKTIGNICMDMTMLDIDGVNAKVGDEVEIFSSQKDIHEIAKTIGTIPYEILTSISDRVPKVFLKE